MIEKQHKSHKLYLQVYVKLKPCKEQESSLSKKQNWEDGYLNITDNNKSQSQAQSFGPYTSIISSKEGLQYTKSKVIDPLIKSFHNNINCTIFVYGQTGSGKTHQLFGPPKFFNINESEWGVCPKTIDQIIEETDKNTQLTISVVEIYFDDCYDLLNKKVRIPISGFGANQKSKATNYGPGSLKYDKDGKWVPPIQQKENGKWTVGYEDSEFEAKGQTFQVLKTREDMLQIMQLVESTRTAKSHAINDRSSRSHCIVQLNKITTAGKKQITTKFMFVDLAGSERITKSEVINFKASEAKNINQSLSALGRCINELSKNGTGGHIPYRDSALTMMMKESLSGNCKTSLIVTIAESQEMVSETISTLRFGMTCGKISSEQKQQKEVDVDQKIDYLRAQLADLNQKISQLEQDGACGGLNHSFPKPTRDGFLQNFYKMQQNVDCLQKCQIKLKDPQCNQAKINEEMQAFQIEVVNLKGIIIRQITTGIWKEPMPTYINKIKGRKNIETQLNQLVGDKFPSREDEIIYNLNFSDLLKELKATQK